MRDIRQLASQFHEIAWSAVQGEAADPWAGVGGTREERRAGALQLLAIYSQMIKVLERRIDLTIKDALDAGSDYGGIAAAYGGPGRPLASGGCAAAHRRDGSRYRCHIRGLGNHPATGWNRLLRFGWSAARMTGIVVGPRLVRC